MLVRLALQTVATALMVVLVPTISPAVGVTSTQVMVASAVWVGLANASVRPLLRFALHPVTVPWVALLVVLVNVLAALLGPALTMSWGFESFGAAVGMIVAVSAVSVLTAVVPLSRSDRLLAWGLNEPKTPGAGPIERRPQLEDEQTAH